MEVNNDWTDFNDFPYFFFLEVQHKLHRFFMGKGLLFEELLEIGFINIENLTGDGLDV